MAADDTVPDDVPEADAIDQRREASDAEVADEEAPAARDEARIDQSLEVPEADALDQARSVSDDDAAPEG